MRTEKEKMLAGEVYECSDPNLINRWHEARRILKEYNATDSTDKERLMSLLDQLLGSHGKNVWIAAPFFCDYGENIFLGENCEINFNCTFLDCNTITIGKNALIAPNVQLYAAYHPIKASDRLPDDPEKGFAFCKNVSAPITIGDNVWIGGGSIVLPGVTIGNNVTIGAGSVVTRNIPDNSLAVGNPCRVIRKIE